NRSTTRRLLPSTGSGRLPFPGFRGTMRRSDARPPLPPRSVAFARRYHPVRLCSCLPQARRRLGAWGFRVWQPRANVFPEWRRPGLPSSWGTLVFLRPVLRPRQVRTHQAITVRQHGPRVVNREGITRQVPFGAQWHGLGTRCLRFAAPVTGAPRQTRFRSLARLSRMGLVTHRVPLRGFRSTPTLRPPFPSFLAQGHLTFISYTPHRVLKRFFSRGGVFGPP